MKRLADLPAAAVREALRGPGLRLRTGPVVMAIRSTVPQVQAGLALHYAEHPIADGEFADFHVGVALTRRWHRPHVTFELDGTRPFNPLPRDQGFPLLEWGMNWCVSSQCHQYLTLHAGVLERDGRALLLPAPSGSGKSTLCAALAFRGWRLMSDELAVLDPRDGRIVPIPRPLSLKNASISLIQAFAPEAIVGPRVTETSKGDVAHVKPPSDSVQRSDERVYPAWLVLPRFEVGSAVRLTPLHKAEGLMKLIENAFNFHVHGAAGFELLADTAERVECFRMAYGDLAEAVDRLDHMAASTP